MMPTPLDEITKQGLKKAEALFGALEEESELLAKRSIDEFESLQPAKLELIESLQAIIEALNTEGSSTSPDTFTYPEELSNLLGKCRQQHEKNAIVIERLLKSNTAALNVLRASRRVETTETYDRLGKVKQQSTLGHTSEV
jgi:flagellar biosynthesis/type III secretory pathway chaperone